jgi:anti-anti-sigma factor
VAGEATGVIDYRSEKVRLSSQPGDAPGTLIIVIEGQLVTDNSPEVVTQLQKIFEMDPLPSRLVVDLRDLRYASSTGIGAIARLLVECNTRLIPLDLANIPANVKSIFDLLGFSSFFSFIER